MIYLLDTADIASIKHCNEFYPLAGVTTNPTIIAKENREFWKTAVARILCDTPSVTVFQYSDMRLSKLVIQLFTDHTQQDRFRIYPVVSKGKRYLTDDGKEYSGSELIEEGIVLCSPEGQDNWHEMLEITLQEI